jgi:hypothetical protein
MDIDPMEFVEDDGDEPAADARAEAAERREAERRKSRLNSVVAVAVAVLATFMGICKVKDDNIVQAMQQAQADKIDQWAFYQARNIREEIATAELATLRLQAPPAGAARAAYDSAVAGYRDLARREHEKKEGVRRDAEAAQTRYDALNVHDDQFDLSDALLAIAISLLALTALTQKRWLFAAAMVFVVFGVLMGLAGLFSWSIHPDTITGWLS